MTAAGPHHSGSLRLFALTSGLCTRRFISSLHSVEFLLSRSTSRTFERSFSQLHFARCGFSGPTITRDRMKSRLSSYPGRGTRAWCGRPRAGTLASHSLPVFESRCCLEPRGVGSCARYALMPTWPAPRIRLRPALSQYVFGAMGQIPGIHPSPRCSCLLLASLFCRYTTERLTRPFRRAATRLQTGSP